MGETSQEERPGCGLLNAVFGRNKLWPRRSASAGSLPCQSGSNNGSNPKSPSNSSSKRRRGGSDGAAFLDPTLLTPESSSNKPVAVRSAPNQQKMPPVYQQNQSRKPPNEKAMGAPAARSAPAQSQGHVHGQGRKVLKGTMGISGELESMISEHQSSNGGNANLVRASSGNVMLYGHLGNLRQPGTNAYSNTNSSWRAGREASQMAVSNNGAKYANSVTGNVVKTQNENEEGNPLCRALSCRMDPEDLKILGNEDYKNGRFAEALALYERAIDLDPTKASYRSNKSAALTALGRLLEAVFECREAIRIEPQYHRAHHRLANLYLRLGEANRAIYHFNQAGSEADPDAITKAKTVLVHLKKCDEAKRLKDWITVLKESGNAIAGGADSAPMMFALQAEALLKLHRHDDADMAWSNGPNFEVDQCTKFFGPAGNAVFLILRAQVDVAAGRFDNAMAAVLQAAQLDPTNKEMSLVSRRARAVAAARSEGNGLFKASRFSEASAAYGQGLHHDPYNSVLLCNRAACYSKLGQFERAVEDCTAALNLRPSYAKARLRRADCSAKLKKWEAALKDYEMLARESPGDEEVGRALFEAQVQLKKQLSNDVGDMKYGDNNVVVIQSNDSLINLLTSTPGLSVVLFCNKPGDRQTLQLMHQLCKRYPTIDFLKVEAEDHHSFLQSQGVSSLPVFNIYKNGSRVKEVPGNNHELLESAIKDYTG
ncbi:hypothetical protein Nepgr_026051 [Nepenthes gracilis]|uniref:Thioredoxin domain-containing protein n=1 Tax=Nepenthes gracilis TaxID=150966 RepID=A0AAD3Y087_NEPGR|nr:hypothetical protein Nepgr_026051 [Nepenthes gracilis]